MSGRRRVTVVGAGNVGATCAELVARSDYAEVVLVDIKEGLPQGKALDINQMGALGGYEPNVVGANDYAASRGSAVVVITAGLPRAPGMSRDDLVTTNERIVADVVSSVVAASPDAIIIVVSNPLDAMCHVARSASGLPRERVFGMAGILDTARFRTFIAWETGASVKDVSTLVLGGHGDQMVPLVSATRVGGVPLAALVSEQRIEALIARTATGGGEIVELLGTSAWYAPGAAAAQIVDAIMLDDKRVLPCAAYLEGEYGIEGLFVGVPVRLGAAGIEAILELELNPDEQEKLERSAAAVAEVVALLGARRLSPRRRGSCARAAVYSEPVALRARLVGLITPGRVLVLGLVLLAGASALWVIPSRDYIFLPDRAHPVAPLVKVAGGHDPDNGGGIYFVDVIVRKASLLEELFGGLESGASLYPASAVVPAGVTSAQQNQVDLSEMASSQQIAAAVALRALGRKVTVTDTGAVVAEVEPGYPAARKLEPTDVIVAVDGTRVRTPAGRRGDDGRQADRLDGRRSRVLRNGKKLISLRTVAESRGSRQGIVGIYLDQQPAETIHLPIRVSIDAHGVGGPSAGLAFALEVLQQLGRNVDHGLKIAATGELSLNGEVGQIGGIEQKTIGAREAHVDAFLVPAGQNATDAQKYAHGLRIIPVKSFQQALRALATLARAR